MAENSSQPNFCLHLFCITRPRPLAVWTLSRIYCGYYSMDQYEVYLLIFARCCPGSACIVLNDRVIPIAWTVGASHWYATQCRWIDPRRSAKYNKGAFVYSFTSERAIAMTFCKKIASYDLSLINHGLSYDDTIASVLNTSRPFNNDPLAWQ